MGLPHYLRETKFDVSLAKIAPNSGRHHGLDYAIEWTLLRAPRRFLHVGDDYYLWKMAPHDGFPAFRILYRYLEIEDTVIVQTIHAVGPQEDSGPSHWTPPDLENPDF